MPEEIGMRTDFTDGDDDDIALLIMEWKYVEAVAQDEFCSMSDRENFRIWKRGSSQG